MTQENLIQVSKNIYVNVYHYKNPEEIKKQLLSEPTHEPCNSSCADCSSRKFCRWAPWNLGKPRMKAPTKDGQEEEKRIKNLLKSVKCIDGQRKRYTKRNVPGKWLWRYMCENVSRPCYKGILCISCVTSNFLNRQIYWSNEFQCYLFEEEYRRLKSCP